MSLFGMGEVTPSLQKSNIALNPFGRRR